MQRGGSDYLNDGCQVWGVPSDSWAHCLYGQLEGGERRNTGTEGWVQGQNSEGKRGGARSHLGTLQEEKINSARTHIHTGALTTWDRAWHLKGKSWHWLHHCHPDCHKAAANIKTFFISAARGYWHQKLFSSPSAAGLLPWDLRLLPPPHNILAVDVKLSMYTCHSQSLYRLPLTLCSKTHPPCLPAVSTHTRKDRKAHRHSLVSGLNSHTMKVALNQFLCVLWACMHVMLLIKPLFLPSAQFLNKPTDYFSILSSSLCLFFVQNWFLLKISFIYSFSQHLNISSSFHFHLFIYLVFFACP